MLQCVLKACVFLFGFHCVKIKGQQATAEEAPIAVVAPHSSIFDMYTLLLGPQIGTGVAKEEAARAPLIGRMYHVECAVPFASYCVVLCRVTCDSCLVLITTASLHNR